MGYHNSWYQLDYQHHESKNCEAHYTDQYGLHWLGTYQSILPTMVPYCRIIRACFISNSITNITEINHVCAEYYRCQISQNITDDDLHGDDSSVPAVGELHVLWRGLHGLLAVNMAPLPSDTWPSSTSQNFLAEN